MADPVASGVVGRTEESPGSPNGFAGPPYDLNLGAGHTRIPGFVNIDIDERADVSLDLGVDRLPFADNSVRTVFSVWTLEHVSDYLFALSEIHRVLRHDGELLLKLPYVSLTELHLVNPYHLHNFNERSFDLFDPELLKGSADEAGDTAFRKVFVRYTYMGWFGLAPGFAREWARRHLLNVVRQFDIGLVAIKDPEQPVDAGPARARSLEARLAELNGMRVPYREGPLAPRPRSIEGRSPALVRRALRGVQRRTQLRYR